MNELQNLKDIHMPAGVSMWPLAPGWYAVSLVILVSFIIAIYRLNKWFKYNKPKKQAIKLLKRLRNAPDTQSKLTQVALLLKRVGIQYHGAQQVAKLSGRRWIDFLNKTSRKSPLFTAQSTDLLTKSMYENKPKLNANQLSLLIQQSETWIKQQ